MFLLYISSKFYHVRHNSSAEWQSGATYSTLRYTDCHALFDAACIAVGGTGTSIQRGSGRLHDKYCLALSDVSR